MDDCTKREDQNMSRGTKNWKPQEEGGGKEVACAARAKGREKQGEGGGGQERRNPAVDCLAAQEGRPGRGQQDSGGGGNRRLQALSVHKGG